jgi:Xaa-Pro aminopeptidase
VAGRLGASGALTVERPEIPAARFAERLARARALAAERGLAGLLIGVGADLRYLTGYVAPALERLTMLVLPAAGPATLIAPQLEAMKAAASPVAAAGEVEVAAWSETDDPYALVAARLAGTAHLAVARRLAGTARTAGARADGLTTDRLLVSADLWSMHLLGLQRALPGRTFGLATEVLRELRMVKAADEIALLRLAARAADRALAGVAAGPLVGRTEVELSREVRDRLVAEGHDEAAFAIVASGPNSASPHHEPGERRIAAGEPIVFDVGGFLGGYGSDTTRTVWVAGPGGAVPPDAAFLEIHALVQRAQAAATAAVRAGVACGAIDAAARALITAAGHGSAFVHRVGHGIGLETHEEPYLVAGNAEPLRPGVAFSIEPGAYLDGRFGVRIEDIVVCGAAGPEVLNDLPRDAWVVTG